MLLYIDISKYIVFICTYNLKVKVCASLESDWITTDRRGTKLGAVLKLLSPEVLRYRLEHIRLFLLGNCFQSIKEKGGEIREGKLQPWCASFPRRRKMKRGRDWTGRTSDCNVDLEISQRIQGGIQSNDFPAKWAQDWMEIDKSQCLWWSQPFGMLPRMRVGHSRKAHVVPEGSAAAGDR